MKSIFIVCMCLFISFFSCKTISLFRSVDNSQSASLLGEIHGTVSCQIANLLENSKFWLDIKLISVEKNNIMESVLVSSIIKDVVSRRERILFIIQYNPGSLDIVKKKYALMVNIYHGKRLICHTKEPYPIFTNKKPYEENVNIILGNIA